MRLRKSPKPSSLRQRLRPDQAQSRQSVAQTFSYHKQRSDPSSNTGRKFRQQVLSPMARNVSGFWAQRFGLAILLIVLGFSLFNALSLSADVKLQQLSGPTASSLFHNQADYKSMADKLIRSSLLNHNKITVNTAHIDHQLLQSYPELDSATLALPLLSHRPILYLVYTRPAIILHNQSGSFVLDTAGKTLTPTSPEAVALGLASVKDESGYKLALNSHVLTKGDITFIQAVVSGLKAKNVPIGEMRLPPSANELDVSLVGQPYFIKFNLHAEQAKQQIGTFLAVQQHLAGQSITPATYIDVRVDGRAYYK